MRTIRLLVFMTGEHGERLIRDIIEVQVKWLVKSKRWSAGMNLINELTMEALADNFECEITEVK